MKCGIVLLLGMVLLAQTIVVSGQPALVDIRFYESGMRSLFVGDLVAFPNVPEYTYNLTLTADYEQATLAGTGRIRYTNTTPEILNDLVLRLYPNLESFGGNAIVENLHVDGQPVAPSLDETRTIVGIILPQPLSPNASVTLEFNYSTTVIYGVHTMYAQYSYLETELALASPLPLLSVYEPGSGWWRGTTHVQGDAVYSEVGNFDVTVRAPDYLTLIASGSEVETTEQAGMIVHRYAAPLMRDFALMASAKYASVSIQMDDITIQVHYLEGNERNLQGAQKVLGWAVDAMTAYSQAFGAYVYRELDIVQTHTSAGGIEYPGLIVVADSIWNPGSQRWFEWVTVHEVGHQWWYSMVGNDQTRFPWLDEALTDYSVAIYQGYVKGEVGYQEVINNYTKTYTAYESQNRSDIIGQAPLAYTVEAYSAIVYRKGAVFFHTLSQVLGGQVFLTALQNYLADYRYRVATPDDLQAAFETASGSQLDSLFIQWVGYSN